MDFQGSEEATVVGRIRWRKALPAVTAVTVVGLLVLALSRRGEDRPTEVQAGSGTTVSTSPSTSPTTGASRPAQDFGQVVWAQAGDIWLFDSGTGERRALTSDGQARYETLPRFWEAARVTYLSYAEGVGEADLYGAAPDLMEIDLRTGAIRRLREFGGPVRAYDWSPDGQTLAFYRGGGDQQATELHVVDGAGRRIGLRRFGPTPGRGGYVNYDETRVDWSPDGRRLLLADTALDTSQDETFYVLDSTGDDILPPRFGTWARWSSHGEKIYCFCAAPTPGATGDGLWQAIDVTTGAATPLPIDGARPSVSPDGRFLAYDDGQETPAVHVLDLDDPLLRTRLLARGALAPLWLDATRVAMTDTRPCPHDEDTCLAGGHGSMFESAGAASVVDVNTEARTAFPAIETDGADAAPGN
jgi:hypothetical protein